MNKSLHFGLTILIVLGCFFSNNIYGQTTLGLGEIAFTGYQSDPPNKISFILLKPIEAGTKISFTDSGWLAAGGFRTFGPGIIEELAMTWTADIAYPCGAQIQLLPNTSESFAEDGTPAGTLVNPDITVATNDPFPNIPFAVNLNQAGDQLFAFQGAFPTATNMSGFLAAIQMNGPWQADATNANTSALPSVFTDGVNSLFIDPQIKNASYACGPPQFVLAGETPAQVAAMVNNSSNWSVSSNANLDIPPTCDFLVCCTILESVASTDETCLGDDGTITMAASFCSLNGSYTITGPVTMTNTTGIFTGLPTGNYMATAEDTGLPAGTCTASQTIVVGEELDVESPMVVTPLAPVTDLTCGATLPDPPQTAAGFIAQGGLITDDCTAVGDLSFSAQETETGDLCSPNNLLTVTRTFTISDAAGNSTTTQQTFTFLEDVTEPVISCPADVTIECDASTSPVNNGTATATDNCSAGAEVEITFTDVSTQTTTGCGQYQYEITRTWRAEDACGNTSECTQIITVEDTTDPVIICPANDNLSCTDATNPATTGTPAVTDNCSAAAEIVLTSSDVTTQTATGCGQYQYEITRTWRAEDACGNTSECTQIITIEDTTAPDITCPADANLSCTDATGPAATGMPVVTDDCSALAEIIVTSSDETTQSAEGCNQFTYTILRTWLATDACGNSASCVQTIAVTDTEAPVITCPPNQTLTCFETIPSPYMNAVDFIAAGGTIGDNCTTALSDFTVFAQNSDNGGDNCPGNARQMVRTYYVADACGNISICTQTFTYLESEQGPVITSVLPSCYKYCESLVNPMEGDITYDTDCSFDGVVNITGPTQIGQDNCPGTIYRYTYTVTDDCGRISAPVTRDFIIGNNGPTIECAPFNLILECGNPNNQEYIDTHLGIVTVNTSCGLGYTVNHFPQNFNLVSCASATVVTFVATDACGRTASCTTTIAVQDSSAPTFTEVPPSVCDVIECGADANYWFDHWIDYMVTGLVATDDCDNNVSISALSPQLNTTCGADGKAVSVVSFAATDNCSNSKIITGTFTIENTSPAVFMDVPANMTISCSEVLAFGTPVLSEQCETTLTFTDATDNSNPCAVQYTRIWTATDACGGLTTMASQTITVEDTDGPMFTNTPTDVTISCADPLIFGTPTVTDACTMNPTLTFEDEESGTGCTIMHTRTWTATDACGLTATASQTITVEDMDGPVFSNTPADETIACNEAVSFGVPTVTDACTMSPTVDFVDEQSGSGCNIVYTRTWTATDACGNTSTFSQNITATDTEAPSFTTVPGDYTGPCIDDNGIVTAYAQICASSDDAEEDKEDGDEGKMNLTSSDLELVLDDSQNKNVEVGMRFKDLNIPAGAQITSAYIQFYADATIDVDPSSITIHGEDSDNALTFTTEDFNISSRLKTSAAVDWEPGDWQVIGDNHEEERTPDLTAIVQEIVDRGGYTSESALAFFINGTGKRTAIAYDLNPSQAPQLYVTYQAPSDVFGMATASDDCDDSPNITFSDLTNGDCAGSKIRTWVATDACGNSSTATQTLNFTDNIPPVFTFVPTHVNGDCDTITFPPTFGDPVFVDNCDANTNLTFTDFFYEGDVNSCADEVDYDYRRLWVATDACGNSTTAVQRFNINGTDYSSLSGFIYTEEEAPVEEVEVSLEGFNGFNMMSMSQGNGTFGYNSLNYGLNYTVAPKSNKDPLNGISTYDIVLMSRHILQLETLDSPYKIIAADVNKSGSVTTFDMVELRKMILLINEEFENNNSWRFVESDYTFPDPGNPFNVTFPEETFINGLVEGAEQNYIGIKVGDLNNTAIPNSVMALESRTATEGITLLMDDVELEAGEEYEVAVRAADFDAITGFQFALNFNAAKLEFIDLSPAMLPALGTQNFGLTKVNEGRIVSSWNHNEALSFDAEAPLFKLTFKAKANVRLSEALSIANHTISAEAYNRKLELLSLDLRFEGSIDSNYNKSYTLYQNQPNPFKTNTIIGFELPAETTATISFYDLSGRLVKEITNDFPKGYNQITVDKMDLNGNGVLYYRLLTSDYEATKKMMVIE